MKIKTYFKSSFLSEFADVNSILKNYVGVDPKYVEILSNNREGYGVPEYQILRTSTEIAKQIKDTGYRVDILEG